MIGVRDDQGYDMDVERSKKLWKVNHVFVDGYVTNYKTVASMRGTNATSKG